MMSVRKPNIFLLPKEYRNSGILYHSTKINNLDFIIREHKIYLKAYPRSNRVMYGGLCGLSFSRCKHFNYGAYVTSNGDCYLDGGEIQFAVDYKKIKNKYKLVPYNYLITESKFITQIVKIIPIAGCFDIYDESEELLLTNEQNNEVDITESLLFIRVTKLEFDIEEELFITTILKTAVKKYGIKIYDRYFNEITEKIKTSN